MFEVRITNKSQTNFNSRSLKSRFYDHSLHSYYEFKDDRITVEGLNYKEKDNFQFENKDHLFLIVGTVYSRFGTSSTDTALSAKDLAALYDNEEHNYTSKIKGNFILIIYNKNTGRITILKDQLGLRPLYYKAQNGEFYVSTNLSHFKTIEQRYNRCVILEKLLFTYPISNQSYLLDIYTLGAGEIISFWNGKLSAHTYFKIDDLFSTAAELPELDESKFLNLFERSVLQRSSNPSPINVSLTGGFDGRANVAVLCKNKAVFKSYSFGIKGGENTSIPLELDHAIGLNYEPIFLNESYERNYLLCAKEAIQVSDGLSQAERANYIFAARNIAPFSYMNITGLIGGEVFAPVHLKSDYINETYFNIIYNGASFNINELLAQKNLEKFIQPGYFNETLTILEAKIERIRQQVRGWRSLPYPWLFYLKDLFSRGFIGFYGNQMHLERYYTENLSPFYDLDLLNYLYSTRHIYEFKNAFKGSVLYRRNNRMLQSLVICKNNSTLANAKVDRGYPPVYNFGLRKAMIPYFFFKRKLSSHKAVPDFNSKEWIIRFYSGLTEKDFPLEFIDKEIAQQYIKNFKPENYNKNISALFSLGFWISSPN